MKSKKLLDEFTKYAEEHPEERFWQVLRNFSGYPFIYAGTDKPDKLPEWLTDTFYWEYLDHFNSPKEKLFTDVLNGKFGTKHRAELLTRLEKL